MGTMDAPVSSGMHNATTAAFLGSSGLASQLPELHTVEVLVAVSIFVVIHSLRQRRSLGLSSWPVVGMLPSLLLGVRGDMYEWITGVLKSRGGTFTFRGPLFTNLHCVVTADPRNLEHLLKTKFGNFPKGPYFRDTVRDLLGDGIFGADDEVWRAQRKAASLEFHSAEFRALTASSLVELVHRRLLPVLAETEAAGAAVDLQDVLLRLTFDNVCMIAFGVDPGCLQKGLPEIPFARAFEDATEATIVRFVTPTAVWRGMRALGIGHERVLRRSLAGVDEFAYDVIRKRREELAAAAAGREDAAAGLRRADLLTIFTKMRDADGEAVYSDRFLRDICVNFILAGRDTSSVALAWFFWLLSKNPGVEAKILEEVEGIVAARASCGEVEEELVFQPEEVKRMEYLHAALSEALRLYPSVPVDHKEVIKGHDQESVDLTQSGQDHSDQEDCMAILTNAVERQKLRIRARRASGGTDHPAPPPLVQKPPSAPPDAPAPREWRKRQPTGPPTGSSGTNTSTSTKPPSFKKPASIVCRVCGVRCMTASHLKMHEMGRKHRNKVAYAAGEMNVRCDVCDVPLLSKVNVQEHYAGKQHLHRVFASSSGASSYVARPPATQ